MVTLKVPLKLRPLTSNHSHDERVWYGGLDVQRLFVEGLQFLVILLLRVHLDLQGVHLQQLRPLLDVIDTLLRLTGLVQLFYNPCQAGEVPSIEVEFAQLQRV